MITRPTTDELIRDCCRELTEEILPALHDDTLELRLIMAVTVLGNAAVRAAHEIAWMREETRLPSRSRARSLATQPDDADRGGRRGGRGRAARKPASRRRRRGLRAGQPCSRVGRTGRPTTRTPTSWSSRAAGLLRGRVEVEKAVMADYAIVGR